MRRLVTVAAVALLLSGCAGMTDTQQRTVTGGAGGAAGGALIGALAGNAGLGAAIGGAAGLAGGYTSGISTSRRSSAPTNKAWPPAEPNRRDKQNRAFAAGCRLSTPRHSLRRS